jgi:hypothetical protein
MPDPKTLEMKKIDPVRGGSIRVGAIDEAKARAGQIYYVMLINLTDYCMVLGKINNGNWFSIPTVCRTCTNPDANWCFDNKKYAPVLSCSCTDAPFNLSLSTKPDAQGNGWGATWAISPDCQYAGGVIALQ